MSALDDLRAARALIADPARWTQGALARDEGGREVDTTCASAVCWCAYGALAKGGATQSGIASRYLRQAGLELFELFPPFVNDVLGHADVLRMYGRAIEIAEAQS